MIGLISALLVALIAGTVSLYTTGVLPPLERRVRIHTALVKDLPDDLGQPLRRLLEAEVEELAIREMHRRQPATQERRWNLVQVWILSIFLAVAPVVYTLLAMKPFEEVLPGVDNGGWTVVFTSVTFAFAAALGFGTWWWLRLETQSAKKEVAAQHKEPHDATDG